MVYWGSLVIPIMIFLPNVLWVLFPSINSPSSEEKNEPALLAALENAGRIGVAVVPVFYPLSLHDRGQYYALFVMVLLLLLYYAGWLRFFHCGREYKYLFLPLWRIPIPMAISPVLYFLASAKIVDSFLMVLVAVGLAIGHINISYREYQRIRLL